MKTNNILAEDILFKRFLFRSIEWFRREPVIQCLKELKYNQSRSFEEIGLLQKDKLRRLLIQVQNSVPYYKNIMKYGKSQSDSIDSFEIIKQIPILTKNDIIKYKNQMISLADIRVFPVKTSGSTGQPLKFFKDRVSSGYSYAAMYRGHGWFDVNYCETEAFLWGIPLGTIDYIRAKTRDVILNRFREKKFNLSDDVNNDFYRKIVKRNPKILSGYGTLIYEFAQYLERKHINGSEFNLKAVKYTAEMMYDYQREYIENIFSCPVVSEYGTAETGVVSFQCAKGSNHVMSDCVYVEFEKDPDTGFFRIIVTNLHATGFPIIRYDTGDLVKSDALGKCSCGLPFPIMDEIIGRSSDIVITPEGIRIHSNIFSYIIKELVKKYQVIDQLRFIQKNITEIEVEMVSGTQDNNIKENIARLIGERISPSIKLTFKKRTDLERTKSGKLRYFISRISDG